MDSARTVDLAPGQRALVALVVVVSIVIAVATAGTEAPWGGNTGVVLAPLR